MNDAWCESKHDPNVDWRKLETRHPKEVEIWKHFLRGDLSADNAARGLLATVELERNLAFYPTIWHQWGTLLDALLELPHERGKIVGLLHAIRTLDSEAILPTVKTYYKVTSIDHLWVERHRDHVWGSRDHERAFEAFSPEQVLEWSQAEAAMGNVEGQLCKEGLFPIEWGYENLAYILENRDEPLPYFIARAFAWLDAAARQLWLALPQQHPRSWCYAIDLVPGIKRLDPSGEHWSFWKVRLKDFGDGTQFNEEVRMLAHKCLDRMTRAEQEQTSGE